MDPYHLSHDSHRPNPGKRRYQEKTYDFGLGRIRLITTEQDSNLADESGNEPRVPTRRNRYDLRLARWLLLRGFSWHSVGIYSDWQYTFRTFRLIPEDSLIVDFCIQGDLVNVQKMFEQRLASAFDRVHYVYEDGREDEWSLLHVICTSLLPQRFLLTSYDPLSTRPIMRTRTCVNS